MIARILIAAAVAWGALAARGATPAAAYPQYQLARDATCTGCHISPAGGNMLNENGMLVAEGKSQLGTAPEFFYGKLPLPDWLQLGGDVRGAAGYLQTPERVVAAFPMQLELYARAAFGAFSLHATGGSRPAQFGNEGATRAWSREHYLMWQQKPGESTGVYVRAGRFMPVFGLRWAEHPMYTRRFGGTQLYGESYGLHVAYVDPKFEAHVTGFIEDPLLDAVEHVSGGAVYTELRLGEHAAIGAEGMVEIGDDDKKYRGGLTGKLYLPGPALLLQAEGQFINQRIDPIGAPNQLLGHVMVSRMLGEFVMLDVGIGHFDSNIRIKNLDRDCIDLNLHWFTTSHVELVLNARYELIGLGDGGDAGAYAIAQLHYRL